MMTLRKAKAQAARTGFGIQKLRGKEDVYMLFSLVNPDWWLAPCSLEASAEYAARHEVLPDGSGIRWTPPADRAWETRT